LQRTYSLEEELLAAELPSGVYPMAHELAGLHILHFGGAFIYKEFLKTVPFEKYEEIFRLTTDLSDVSSETIKKDFYDRGVVLDAIFSALGVDPKTIEPDGILIT